MMEVFPYRLPLKHPLRLPGCDPLRCRRGVLVHDPETGGWGDAAPLPGYSRESMDEVLSALRSESPDSSELPSLRFALECASRPFDMGTARVRINALWIVEMEPLSLLLKRLRNWKAPVIKVKPGRMPRTDEILRLIHVRPDCRLRIDANRQWSVEQTLGFFGQIPKRFLQYIEEPLSDPLAYDALWARAEVPVGLDESLLRSEGRELAARDLVRALILKPTLIGNAEDRRVWTTLAAERKLSLVWSSCFESGVGIRHLLRLAAGGVPAGLDTASVFTRDLLTPRPETVGGYIQTGPCEVNPIV